MYPWRLTQGPNGIDGWYRKVVIPFIDNADMNRFAADTIYTMLNNFCMELGTFVFEDLTGVMNDPELLKKPYSTPRFEIPSYVLFHNNILILL